MALPPNGSVPHGGGDERPPCEPHPRHRPQGHPEPTGHDGGCLRCGRPAGVHDDHGPHRLVHHHIHRPDHLHHPAGHHDECPGHEHDRGTDDHHHPAAHDRHDSGRTSGGGHPHPD